MQKTRIIPLLAILFVSLILVSCIQTPQPTRQPTEETPINAVSPEVDETPAPTASATPEPPRVLTVCMGSEPSSLFLYGDPSVAARSVRQAIYDGPFDILDFQFSPVILEKKPSISDGDVVFEAVAVKPGSYLIDADGNLATLEEGVRYFPSGCRDDSCAAIYSGQDEISMDQLVVRFQLLADIQWSDGVPLTADDSVYSYEVAHGLYPQVGANILPLTQSYRALDERSVEWRGVPGYQHPSYTNIFFIPLPRHAWGSIPLEELVQSEIATRTPLGWGPYQIDEWTPGDHITLNKNPNYFRAGEGLPYFDHLVFRFMDTPEEALEALLAQECDYVDETAGLHTQLEQALSLQGEGRIQAVVESGTAWEHADFGLLPADGSSSLFGLRETRQAVALCIDRQGMVQEIYGDQAQILDAYLLPEHPFANPEIETYPYDPQLASDRLQSIGWVDSDGDAATPRISMGVSGVPDGTVFQFTYLIAQQPEVQQSAQILKESLAQCGIQVEVNALPSVELMAPGPEGPIFGRNFQMAQFAWITAVEPPCFLYTSEEIPGPYPEFSKGWGGANVTGYSSPDFDRSCRQALSSLPDTPEHKQAHFEAQSIFAQELPSIPLFGHMKAVAARPDLCNLQVDVSATSALWNLENFNYGDDCAVP